MKIDVSQIKKEIGARQQYSFAIPDSISRSEGCRFKNLWLDITLLNQVDYLEANGQIHGIAECLCDRCLTEFTKKIEMPFTERFRTHAGGYWTAEDDEESAAPFAHDEIDFTRFVKETIMLNAPMRNLCQPDCRGICPECGANLNFAPCGCERQAENPRMAALSQLLKEE